MQDVIMGVTGQVVIARTADEDIVAGEVVS